MEEYHNWKKRADASVTENCIFVFFKLAIGHANFFLASLRAKQALNAFASKLSSSEGFTMQYE